MEKPKYNLWIRKKNIIFFWTIVCFLVALSMLGFMFPFLFLISLFSIPFIYIAVIISLTAYTLSPRGDDVQNKIHQAIIGKSGLKGKIIDIGCGSGNLIIKMAKSAPGCNYTGIDFWGKNWEYSKSQCVRNAELENIKNMEFIKASASRLPFEDETFDHAVSCLTFHEVGDVKNKTDPLAEALRVIKNGGSFVFFDLFDDPKYYKSIDDVSEVLKQSGGVDIKVTPVSDIIPMRFPLNTKKVLKYAVLIEGRKADAL